MGVSQFKDKFCSASDRSRDRKRSDENYFHRFVVAKQG